MFKTLLNKLANEHKGQELYIPDALYDMVKDWMCRGANKNPMRVNNIKWRGKTVLPYDESKVLQAYQSCPIHIPERILEQTYVIECSLRSPEELEAERQAPQNFWKEEVHKPQTEEQKPKVTVQPLPKTRSWSVF